MCGAGIGICIVLSHKLHSNTTKYAQNAQNTEENSSKSAQNMYKQMYYHRPESHYCIQIPKRRLKIPKQMLRIPKKLLNYRNNTEKKCSKMYKVTTPGLWFVEVVTIAFKYQKNCSKY